MIPFWVAVSLLPLSADSLSSHGSADRGSSLEVALTSQSKAEAEITALYDEGLAYLDAREYAAALIPLEAGLSLVAANDDELRGVATDLSGSPKANDVINFSSLLGEAHQQLGHFGSALNYYRQALSGGPLLNEDVRAVLLLNIGTVEAEIGQYDQAELTLQRAIALNQRLDNPHSEASATLSLGWVYEQQDDFDRAIAQYEAAISLYQQVGSPDREAATLNNLGLIHLWQGDLSSAEKTLDQGWALLQQEENAHVRSLLLDSYGQLFLVKAEPDRAWSQHLQSLQLSVQTDNNINAITALLNLAALMEARAEPELAIFFYKQAIAKIEVTRNDLKQLSDTVQQRYTATVEDFYRKLADLLLQQNRTTEALQILELLKLQEVRAYLQEQTSQDKGGSLDFLYTPAEAELDSVLTGLLGSSSAIELTDFLQLPEARAVATDASAADLFELETIESLRSALSAQPIKTAALYPLVLFDRLELILITADTSPIHYTVDISKAQLTQTVNALQSRLSADTLDPTELSQQLYSYLIAPLDQQLEAQNIENIVYLPDGILRYIPLAVLHDGEQWLAQKYQSHNITAASIDDLIQPRSADLTVIAGALTEDSPTHQVTVGQSSLAFDGLSGAKQEIDRLLTLMPDTVALFDQSFTPDTVIGEVNNHQIVHLATHAKFLSGQPEDSFVLFGDGSIVTMRELGDWQLPNVELVVFSACQTAIGIDSDGKEILGLGFQMQQTGANSAIASLWAVDDTSTAALMNQFYSALKDGQSKAQALQQAQSDLINSQRYSHPYYWAAFILIGNGL